eukprot:7268533-Lingulodinium_polyedra.AAC.1
MIVCVCPRGFPFAYHTHPIHGARTRFACAPSLLLALTSHASHHANSVAQAQLHSKGPPFSCSRRMEHPFSMCDFNSDRDETDGEAADSGCDEAPCSNNMQEQLERAIARLEQRSVKQCPIILLLWARCRTSGWVSKQLQSKMRGHCFTRCFG